MNAPVPQDQPSDEALRARRQQVNVRLGYLFGAIAFALFLLAFWKYRPL